MFTVYKITNKINNKCYVGSSVQVEKRWRTHKNCAFNPNDAKYNYPLYQAFRKYGLDNFSFEVLKDDFNTIDEMSEYEYQMILEYNSLQHGYNQVLATDRPTLARENGTLIGIKTGQKCAKIDIYNNILETYTSYHDAARKNCNDNHDAASSIRRVCKGEISHFHNMIFRDLDDNNHIIEKPIKHNHNMKPLVCIPLDHPDEEVYYDSISSAAEALTRGDRRQIQLHLQGSTRFSTVRNCLLRELDIYGNIIENNISIEEKIDEYNKHNPEINGIRHSITDWCHIYKITTQTYYKRLKSGMSQIEAITTKKRK